MYYNTRLSVLMETYLEMISRMLQYNDYIKTNQLARNLNERPQATLKVLNNLKTLEYISMDKAGNIRLTNKGMVYGNYLLHRHEILNKFFSFINSSKNELEQVEKIEHFIDERTLKNIEKILEHCKI